MDETEDPDFTTIEYSKVNYTLDDYSEPDATLNGNADSEESIEHPRNGSDHATDQATGSDATQVISDENVEEDSVTVAVRRHNYSLYLPLLTMLRYCSVIGFSDIVTTSFANPGIHHSAVRQRFSVISNPKIIFN